MRCILINLPGARLTAALTPVWMGLIFWLSVSQSPPGGDFGSGGLLPPGLLPIAGHFLFYAVLTALSIGWLGVLPPLHKRQPLIFAAAVLVSLTYGSIMELLQAMVPGRTPSLVDILVNGLGALAVVALVLAVQSKRKPRLVAPSSADC